LEVQFVERQLQKLDSSKYERAVEKLLDQLIEDNALNVNDIGQETKQAIKMAKANPSVENWDRAEELVCQNGADNSLSKLCQKVENKISQAKLTEKKCGDLIKEIQEFISENGYCQVAYTKNQDRTDALISKLLS
jgi:hypothetical protein